MKGHRLLLGASTIAALLLAAYVTVSRLTSSAPASEIGEAPTKSRSLALELRKGKIGTTAPGRLPLEWVYSPPKPDPSSNRRSDLDRLVMGSAALLVAPATDERIAALDARNGRELWTLEMPENKTTGPSPDYWSLRTLGIAVPEHGNPIAVIANDHQGVSRESEINAVDIRTGATIWSAVRDEEPARVVGGAIVYAGDSTSKLKFQDAGTGKWTANPKGPLGTARSDPLARINANQQLLNLSGLPCIMDLSSGAIREVPIPTGTRTDPNSESPRYLPIGGLYSTDYTPLPLFAMAGKIVMHIDTDDGRVGGSRDPKFLFCCDQSGKRLWRFPATSVYENYSPTSSSRIERALPLGQIGIIIAQEDYTFKGKVNWFHGVRISDGKPIWKTKIADLADCAQLQRGALILGSVTRSGEELPNASIIYYLDGLQGRATLVARVPVANKLAVQDDHLYLMEPKHLYSFSLSKLLKRKGILDGGWSTNH